MVALRSKEAAVRSGAVNLVGPGDDTVVTALLELLDDPEEAVRAYLFERAVEQAKAATAGMGEAELNDLIDEAVQWAREH